MSMKNDTSKGFTLIELMVAIGLFASIMAIAAGAYLTMIHVDQQAQAIATGIDNVSFALGSMTRNIRSGSEYCGGRQTLCGSQPSNTFTFTDETNNTIEYAFNPPSGTTGGSIQETINGGLPILLTAPSVNITRLDFYSSGVESYSWSGDINQPYVEIIVSGTVSAGPGSAPQSFSVESSAAWRGSDI